MKTTLRILIATISLASAASEASAKVELPHIFSDNMMLQADTTAMLWGKATPGARVEACGSWGGKANTVADADGKWRMSIATPAAGYTPLTLKFHDSASPADTLTLHDILAGEVWVASGQSNMEMPLRGFWNQPVEGGGEQITFSRKLGRGVRFITVPKAGSYEPFDDIDASWQQCYPATVADFSALGWFFATALRDIIDTPVGIISCSYGGSKLEGWLPAEIIANYPDRNLEAERADTSIEEFARVNVMYNAMLLPIAGFTARGFLWNQGESNVGAHTTYPARQAEMLDHWRKLWGNDAMPFYFVELPGWEYSDPDGIEAALFREAQHDAAAATDGAYIVCTSDLVYPDEPDDIHARNKRSIGIRMAALAATHTYGIKGVPHTFPTFRSMTVDGPKAVLSFNNAWQGFTPNNDLEGFEAAAADGVFHPAKATIDRSHMTIIVTLPGAERIEAVRYCFRNFAIGRIHDMNGMPLVPFRTDRPGHNK